MIYGPHTKLETENLFQHWFSGKDT